MHIHMPTCLLTPPCLCSALHLSGLPLPPCPSTQSLQRKHHSLCKVLERPLVAQSPCSSVSPLPFCISEWTSFIRVYVQKASVELQLCTRPCMGAGNTELNRTLPLGSRRLTRKPRMRFAGLNSLTQREQERATFGQILGSDFPF